MCLVSMFYHQMYPLSVSMGICNALGTKMHYTIQTTLPTVWYGLLVIRRGLYQGALFKFTLLIPANYPDGGCPVRILILHNIVGNFEPV